VEYWIKRKACDVETPRRHSCAQQLINLKMHEIAYFFNAVLLEPLPLSVAERCKI